MGEKMKNKKNEIKEEFLEMPSVKAIELLAQVLHIIAMGEFGAKGETPAVKYLQEAGENLRKALLELDGE